MTIFWKKANSHAHFKFVCKCICNLNSSLLLSLTKHVCNRMSVAEFWNNIKLDKLEATDGNFDGELLSKLHFFFIKNVPANKKKSKV